jgi:hypothetical protein
VHALALLLDMCLHAHLSAPSPFPLLLASSSYFFFFFNGSRYDPTKGDLRAAGPEGRLSALSAGVPHEQRHRGHDLHSLRRGDLFERPPGDGQVLSVPRRVIQRVGAGELAWEFGFFKPLIHTKPLLGRKQNKK